MRCRRETLYQEWEDLYKTLEADGNLKISGTVDGTANRIIDTARDGSYLDVELDKYSLFRSQLSTTNRSCDVDLQKSHSDDRESQHRRLFLRRCLLLRRLSGCSTMTTNIGEEIERLQDRRLNGTRQCRCGAVAEQYVQCTGKVKLSCTPKRHKNRLHDTTNRYANSLFQISGRVVYQNEIMQKSAEKVWEFYEHRIYCG